MNIMNRYLPEKLCSPVVKECGPDQEAGGDYIMDDGDKDGHGTEVCRRIVQRDQKADTADDRDPGTDECHEALRVQAVLPLAVAGVEDKAVEEFLIPPEAEGGVQAQKAKDQKRKQQNDIEIHEAAPFRGYLLHYNG